jgi:hypothetical protein
VKVEQQFHFIAFLDKWIFFDLSVFISKLFRLLLLRRGDCGNYFGCLQFFVSPEERRQTLNIGVSIGVHGRRVPGPSVRLSVLLDGTDVLMAVT